MAWLIRTPFSLCIILTNSGSSGYDYFVCFSFWLSEVFEGDAFFCVSFIMGFEVGGDKMIRHFCWIFMIKCKLLHYLKNSHLRKNSKDSLHFFSFWMLWLRLIDPQHIFISQIEKWQILQQNLKYFYIYIFHNFVNF